MRNIKWVVYYKKDGQTWSIQRELPSKVMYDYISQEDYDKLPEYEYWLETETGVVRCNKNKEVIDDSKRTKI